AAGVRHQHENTDTAEAVHRLIPSMRTFMSGIFGILAYFSFIDGCLSCRHRVPGRRARRAWRHSLVLPALFAGLVFQLCLLAWLAGLV
ncbi:hypothetical protein, partial [Achromobacter ruhlandii]|uniref:hypothetical protein n=1 Tax=Achromobacter ruhlandii TaxID=72557 RepID=UPI001B8BEBB8